MTDFCFCFVVFIRLSSIQDVARSIVKHVIQLFEFTQTEFLTLSKLKLESMCYLVQAETDELISKVAAETNAIRLEFLPHHNNANEPEGADELDTAIVTLSPVHDRLENSIVSTSKMFQGWFFRLSYDHVFKMLCSDASATLKTTKWMLTSEVQAILHDSSDILGDIKKSTDVLKARKEEVLPPLEQLSADIGSYMAILSEKLNQVQNRTDKARSSRKRKRDCVRRVGVDLETLVNHSFVATRRVVDSTATLSAAQFVAPVACTNTALRELLARESTYKARCLEAELLIDKTRTDITQATEDAAVKFAEFTTHSTQSSSVGESGNSETDDNERDRQEINIGNLRLTASKKTLQNLNQIHEIDIPKSKEGTL
jgi:hypothetical protein